MDPHADNEPDAEALAASPPTSSDAAASESAAPVRPDVAPPPSVPLAREPKGHGCLLALALLVLVNAALIFGINRVAPRPVDVDLDVATRFVDGIVVGPAEAPAREDGRIGYDLAYELLSERKQEELDFAEFVDQFEALQREHGILESGRRLTRETGTFMRRGVRYRLAFLGSRGDPETWGLRVELVAVGEDYRVDEVTPFRLTDEER